MSSSALSTPALLESLETTRPSLTKAIKELGLSPSHKEGRTNFWDKEAQKKLLKYFKAKKAEEAKEAKEQSSSETPKKKVGRPKKKQEGSIDLKEDVTVATHSE